ncbi:MAG: hypothetical protein RIF44_07410 [Nitratireductor sp.]
MSEEIILPFPRRRRSPVVTPDMAARIKYLLNLGLTQHDIAARFKINQGRVSEIKTGMKYPGIDLV